MRARALVLPALACAAALGACDSGGEGSDPTTTAGGGPDGSSAPLYFTAGEQLRESPGPGSSPEAIARALVAGPPANDDAGLDSEIPARTRVEGVRVSGGTATVRLSGGFTGGIPADPGRRTDDQQAAIDARLAQVTYTMTGLDGVERTRVLAGGRPLGPARSRADFAKPSGGPPRERSVRSNRASAAIRAVQKRLVELRYLPPGAVDGIDGTRTRQAVMAFQAWEGLERDGIAGPLTKAALAEARRPQPRGDGPGRRIEVYRDKGVTLLVKRDRTRRAVHTSSGAPGYTTPAGRFEVFRKERDSWSVPYQVWLPWASYFNAGIAFHGYPEVPPHPASHGCVRVPEPEAEHVYDFARIGTTVIVR